MPWAQIIMIVVSLVINMAVGMLQRQRQIDENANAQPEQAPGLTGKTRLGGEAYRSIIFGRCAVDGYHVYGREWGASGDSPNAYTVDVFSLGDFPGVTLAGVLLKGADTVYDTGETEVTTGYPCTGFRDNGTDYLWARFHDGSQTAADSYLTAKFGSLSSLPWTSDFIGTGLPYAVVTALENEDLFSDIPDDDYRFIVDGVPLYDPRQDTTAGGSGSHRWGTPSTYEQTSNPIVAIYNIRRGIYDQDGNKVWGGEATAYELPYAVWSAAMDSCDATVSLKGGGTEPRYEWGAEISLDQDPEQVIERILMTCNAHQARHRGQWLIKVGVPSSAAYAISDDTIMVTERQAGVFFPEPDDVPNVIAATFTDPDSGWTEKEARQRRFSSYITADGGIERVAELDLGWVHSQTQVQRLQNKAGIEARKFNRHAIVLPPEYAGIRPFVDGIAWTSEREGYSAKLFTPVLVTQLPNGYVAVGLLETDQDGETWTPADDELDYDTVPIDYVRPPEQSIVAFSATAATISDKDSNDKRLAILFGWDANLKGVRAVRVQVRVKDASPEKVILDEEILNVSDGSATRASGAFYNGAILQARGKYVPMRSRKTAWTGWIDVTLGEVLIQKDELSDVLRDLRDWMGGSIREIKGDLDEAFLQLSENSSAQSLQQISSNQNLAAAILNSEARVTAAYEVKVAAVASDLGGAVSRIETLEVDYENLRTGVNVNASAINAVQVSITNLDGELSALSETVIGNQVAIGDATASALFRTSASYTAAAGYKARVGFEARWSTSIDYKSAAIFLEVGTGSKSRILLTADQTAILDTDGNVVALFDSGTTRIANARIRNLTATNIKTKSLDADEILVDGTVLTDLIKDKAVSDGRAVAATGVDFPDDGKWHTIISGNVNCTGGKRIVVIFNALLLKPYAGSAVEFCRMQLRRGSNVVAQKYQYGGYAVGERNEVIFMETDDPGDGTFTYSVRMRTVSAKDGTHPIRAEDPTIIMEVYKK
ncbi:MAG: hypothetical protein KDJ19_00740 [Hyphomicrobiaceae bacterium]|nr:hypothetical protein [Hyphomicrobiaceae bacterium]MCC0024635.1 hypothetical protein [Hyphomicrobiaceae bacterium]